MHGNLRRFMPEGRDRAPVTVEAGSTVQALLNGLGAAEDTWLTAVNGQAVERDHVLRPGDVVDCFEPVAGGR
jgi:sulfur carrier protein ThiS